MKLADFVIESNGAASAEEMQALLLGYIQQFGFSRYIIGPTSYRSNAMKERVFEQLTSKENDFGQLSNYPAEWLEHYLANHYMNYDPIYLATVRSMKPYSWAEVVKRTEDEKGLRVMNEAGECGLRSGLGLSIYQSNGTVIGFGFSSEEKNISVDEKCRSLFRIVAFQFYTAYAALCEPRRAPSIELSQREVEVLQWIACGNTKSETATRMAVSEACVKRHCESAFQKLGVNTLASAVARAIRFGLIDPF
jgi:DNA-binding CsgD family transcriptional regulator